MRTLLALTLVAVSASTGYHILNEVKIGGEGGWDYLTVDSAARRLYVSHATHVVVLDLDKGTVVGDIPDTPGVHGIALAPELNKGFISNGRGNNVAIFDMKTLKILGTVPTEMNPDDITYDAKSGRVLAFNGRSRSVTIIDAKSGKAVATVMLPGKPEFAIADGTGKVYDNIEDTNEVVEVDAAKAVVTRKYALTGCEGPSGMAMDKKARRIFSVCGNRVMAVSDPDKGTVIATPAIGAGSDGVIFDPELKRIFAANGNGANINVIEQVDANTYKPLETLNTRATVKTIAYDHKNKRLFAMGAETSTDNQAKKVVIMPNSFTVYSYVKN